MLSAIGKQRTSKVLATAFLLAIALSLWLLYHPDLGSSTHILRPVHERPATIDTSDTASVTADIVHYFTSHPLGPPYKDVFGELGERCRILDDWIVLADTTNDASRRNMLSAAIEKTAAQHFPFLKNPGHLTSKAPLSELRRSFTPGSAGIVIPTSEGTLRFAAHLVVSLRSVLHSNLPIQITYASDNDLSAQSRSYLQSLVESGPPLEFLDITTVFDDASLDLQHGSWAIKPFAALASRFERVILLDADAVFLQPPEVLFEHGAFRAAGAGALLFHDRLLWQHAFAERHEWWRSQVRRPPSAALNRSRVWTEDYAEEGDSGAVVVDKSRADVLVGLLHVCWQNTRAVREEATYRMTYGDKESWWFGLELAGARYEFEEHYAAVVGWLEGEEVCSFVIAHVDEQDRLLWYNGSLLKNKGREEMKHEYEVPVYWMVDGEWRKGATKQDMSCMAKGEPRRLSGDERSILEAMIERARKIDQGLHLR
ncbi:uncharacterized protein E0L32_000434 [Thyridium curvatum]|uniref:Uncharacterized protein n=1 Tax=Thyridium curvatum TaxID=1093900 RepID=A0A507BBQ4_9PEZI|nr:uncharacterized protein E0L32_000434 [Thyridium curvatum]TPX14040.1 hypothetical protein E0L32_000434 [Thyridium curvatum]